MKWSALFALLLLSACQKDAAEEVVECAAGDGFPNCGEYDPSDLQEKVDRSFSNLPVETPLSEVRDELTQIIVDNCARWGECNWRDKNGVDHYFFGREIGAEVLTVKNIDARFFENREIPALGIGMARKRSEVLERVREFLGDAELVCTQGDKTGTCQATLSPGWVRVDFNYEGQLVRVRLDGYHFT